MIESRHESLIVKRFILITKKSIQKIARSLTLYALITLSTVCAHPLVSDNFVAAVTQAPLVDTLVIGSGCAGLAAGFQSASFGKRTVLFTGERPGGQLMGSQLVENMPGIEPQPGADVIDRMWQQAQKAGAYIVYETVASIEPHDIDGKRFYSIKTQEGTRWHALSVILAMGGKAHTLGVPGESEYLNKQIFTCASCEHLRAVGKHFYAIGGGDAAVDGVETVVKSAIGGTLLVRALQMRATPVMQQRLVRLSSINVELGCTIVAFHGDGHQLTHIDIRHVNGAIERRPAQVVWQFIGFDPETALVKNLADLSGEGHIEVDEVQRIKQNGMVQPGFFAAGDVAADHRFHQADYAAAHGKLAAAESIRYQDAQGFSMPHVQVRLKAGYELYLQLNAPQTIGESSSIPGGMIGVL